MFSNVNSLILRAGDMDSENVSLIRLSVSDGQITCSSRGVSLTGIYSEFRLPEKTERLSR